MELLIGRVRQNMFGLDRGARQQVAQTTQHLLEVSFLRMTPSDTDSVSAWVTSGKKTPRSEVVFLSQVVRSSLTKYTGGLVSIHFTTVNNSSVQLGKYPFLNVRLFCSVALYLQEKICTIFR
jgi:hypothetical protein